MDNIRFQIIKSTTTLNQYGEQVHSGTDLVVNRWGSIKKLSGNFYPAGTGQKWLSIVQLTSKYYKSKDINFDDLIIYKGQKYRILEKKFDDEAFPLNVILKLTTVE